MTFVDLSDFRLYYQESGEGPPLVFLHGFTVDSRMWQNQLDFFSREYRVICPDAKGHGRSDAPLTGYSRDDRVEDLTRIADNLQLESFHLVGLSMGGSTAIGFALKHLPRLKSLTLVSAGVAGYSFKGKMGRVDQLAREQGVEVARQKWMEWNLRWFKEDKANVREQMETMMSGYSGAVWRDQMRGKYPRTRDLDHVHRITVPTRILAGAMDRMFVPLAGELRQLIPGSTLRILEGVGHMINMEVPDIFNHDLYAFLQSVSEE